LPETRIDGSIAFECNAPCGRNRINIDSPFVSLHIIYYREQSTYVQSAGSLAWNEPIVREK